MRCRFDLASKRHAVNELHDDELLATRLLNVVNDADVRVIQRRGCARLLQKPLALGLVSAETVREKLQGYNPVELCIVGLIDHTHPALTELLEDCVMGDGFIDHSDPAPNCGILAGTTTLYHAVAWGSAF